jgi:hypothetical protein
MIVIKSNQPPTPSAPKQPFFSHLRKPRLVLILGIIGIITFSSLLGGLVLLQSKQTKYAPVRLKVLNAGREPTRKPTEQPIPLPTTDPTNSWLTYANKSFSIKYPERFTVKEQTLNVSLAYPKMYSSVTFTDQVSTITITAAKNSLNLTLNNALGSGPHLRYEKSLAANKPTKTVNMYGITGIMVEHIAAGTRGVGADVMAIEDGKVYQITIEPKDIDLTTFNFMLPSFTPLHQEPGDETENWKIHIDSSYKYSFRYPTNYALDFNKVASGSPTLTTLYNNSGIQVDTPKYKVEVQDIKNIGLSDVTARNILQLSLEDYVNKKWEYNKTASDAAVPDKKVSAIKETMVDGKRAFQFSVSGKYVDEQVSEKLSEEYTFVFTEQNGHKYKIWYPKSDTVYNQVFNTFTFIR